MLTADALIDETWGELMGETPADGSAADEGAVEYALSLPEFAQRVRPDYDHTDFQAIIDAALTRVYEYIQTKGERGIGKLMIFMPPRHGKTLKVSRLFPAWVLGNLPDTRLIMVSYGASLAKKNSRAVRNLFRNPRFNKIFPGLRLSDDTANVMEWDIHGRGGGCVAAGVGGAITGHGARLLIVDDPVKNRKQAESPTYREQTAEWFTDDLLTRVEEPGGAIVIMHTRWHEKDLAGTILADDPEGWVVIRLPALAETQEERDEAHKLLGLPTGEPDPLGREPGEALWEERYPAEWLEERNLRMGDYGFSALYQQIPRGKTGGLFDKSKIQIVDYVPQCTRIVRFYDLAVTAKRRADYTAGVKLGLTFDMKLVILDMYRAQKRAPDVQDDIAQNAQLDGRGVPIRLEAEKAGIIELDYLMRDERLLGFTMDMKPPEGDKYTRATPFASRVNAGQVLMVRGAWNRALLDELGAFPNGANDDQIDALSGAYDMLANPAEPVPTRFAASAKRKGGA
jgi:predicted phage terminase large subunit-like protein